MSPRRDTKRPIGATPLRDRKTGVADPTPIPFHRSWRAERELAYLRASIDGPLEGDRTFGLRCGVAGDEVDRVVDALAVFFGS